MISKTITLIVSLLIFAVSDRGLEAQEKGAKKPDIRVEGGTLTVNLDKAPAGQVFRTIAQKGKIGVRIDESLLKVPLTDEFEKLPLEQGLRRLISQFQSQNFAMGYVADPAGGRRVVSLEILPPGGQQGTVQEFGKSAVGAEGTKMSKGVQIQKERGLNPAQQKKFEQTGSLPTHIPEGIMLRKERGQYMPGGWSWKYDERSKNFENSKGSSSPQEQEPPSSEQGSEGSGAAKK